VPDNSSKRSADVGPRKDLNVGGGSRLTQASGKECAALFNVFDKSF